MRWEKDPSIHLGGGKRGLALIVSLIVLVCGLTLGGCVHVREWSLDLAKSDTKNAQTVRDVSKELMNGWPTWSGMMLGIAKERINDLPARALTAWAELDWLTCCNDPSKFPPEFCKECGELVAPLDDYTLGYYSGTRIRMLFETIIEGFKQYLPDLVGQLPAELLAIL